jgi:hypothetical protein
MVATLRATAIPASTSVIHGVRPPRSGAGPRDVARFGDSVEDTAEPRAVVAVCSSGYSRHRDAAGFEPVVRVSADTAHGAANATATQASSAVTTLRCRIADGLTPRLGRKPRLTATLTGGEW